jgi:hypothetical protein
MNHFINFDQDTIGEHNQMMSTKVSSLRLQEHLRNTCKVHKPSRALSLVELGRLLSLSVKRGSLSSLLTDGTIEMARSGDPFSRGADSEPQAQMASSKKGKQVEEKRYGGCRE